MFAIFQLVFLGLLSLSVYSAPINSNSLSNTTSQPRIFVLTDISNEPDDQESLVRLLLHADLYKIEGIVTTTSYWLNDTTYPEVVLDVIDAYANVTTNLNAHTEGKYPIASELRSLVKSSHSVYGLAALSNGTLSSGAELLISAVDNSTEPLYVLLWGGATVLAEALDYVNRTSSSEALSTFAGRVHVYSISDQDNAGPWIRKHFPQIPYIASIHGFNQYGLAAWCGISGESYYYFDYGGPDSTLVDDAYIKKHFQLGALGSKYPNKAYIMEGDTPSLLSILPNGLNVPSHPDFGGWGGRYTLADISGASNHYADAVDRVNGVSGNLYVSNQATIWRWRQAFQNEMSARVQWSLSANYSSAVHPPQVNVNETTGTEPWSLSAKPLESFVFDASKSIDPDTNSASSLTFEWMHYRDVSSINQWDVDAEVAQLNFTCLDQACTTVQTQMPNSTLACPDDVCQNYHVILSVTNQGDTPMTRYRRIVLDIQDEEKRKFRVRDEI